MARSDRIQLFQKTVHLLNVNHQMIIVPSPDNRIRHIVRKRHFLQPKNNRAVFVDDPLNLSP